MHFAQSISPSNHWLVIKNNRLSIIILRKFVAVNIFICRHPFNMTINKRDITSNAAMIV